MTKLSRSRETSVFAEAEDFTLPPGLPIRNGHGIDMYSPAVSGGKTVANMLGGTATLAVTIPKDGTYFMWMWFTKYVHDRKIEFRVEQDHKTVASSIYNRPKDKQPNWSYNVQCGKVTATLRAGSATLVITCPPFSGYAGSPIDCVLLTQASLRKEREYTGPPIGGINLGMLVTPGGKTIDWHAFAKPFFARFTVLDAEGAASHCSR